MSDVNEKIPTLFDYMFPTVPVPHELQRVMRLIVAMEYGLAYSEPHNKETLAALKGEYDYREDSYIALRYGAISAARYFLGDLSNKDLALEGLQRLMREWHSYIYREDQRVLFATIYSTVGFVTKIPVRPVLVPSKKLTEGLSMINGCLEGLLMSEDMIDKTYHLFVWKAKLYIALNAADTAEDIDAALNIAATDARDISEELSNVLNAWLSKVSVNQLK